jgi:hypothetical protein
MMPTALLELAPPADAGQTEVPPPLPAASAGSQVNVFRQMTVPIVHEGGLDVEMTVPADFRLAVGASFLGGVITGIEIAAGNTYAVNINAQNSNVTSSCFDTTTLYGNYIYPNITTSSDFITNYKTASILRLRLKHNASAWNLESDTTATSYYWGTGSNLWFGINGGNYAPRKTKEEELRDRLRANLQPEIVTRNRSLWGIEPTDEEIRARTLLLELIGKTAFQRYMRRGFIMVQGRSGTMYKVSGGNVMIVSYIKDAQGKMTPHEKFCVIFSYANLPHTDGVIMRKLIIENDEFSLRKRSNVFKVSDQEKVELLSRVG